VRRKGNVIARVVDNVRASTLMAFVNEAVSEKVSMLCTDQWVSYQGLTKPIPTPLSIMLGGNTLSGTTKIPASRPVPTPGSVPDVGKISLARSLALLSIPPAGRGYRRRADSQVVDNSAKPSV
jgi:hypothetical protein